MPTTARSAAFTGLVTLILSAAAPTIQGETPDHPSASQPSVERGQQIFGVNCGFCHGSGARGGEGGPNLLHSPMVLNDQQGEIIAVVVQNGRPDRGMPQFSLSTEAIADIAAYLHSIPTNGASAPFDPTSILVGNAKAGKAYFYGKGKCTQCHSIRGDLAGIGSKYDPKSLQDNIISGAAVGMLGAPSPTARPSTVTVTLAGGEIIHGTLIAVDNFDVTLTDGDGKRRSFHRVGEHPRVDIKNPMQAHLDMLREWEDRDLHNVTAFLVQQK